MPFGDDWRPGDLALCVRCGFKYGGKYYPERDLRVGRVLVVRKVEESLDPAYRERGIMFLGFDEIAGHTYDQRGFRKINPLTEEEHRSFLADLPQPVEG